MSFSFLKRLSTLPAPHKRCEYGKLWRYRTLPVLTLKCLRYITCAWCGTYCILRSVTSWNGYFETTAIFLFFQVCETTFNFYRENTCGSKPYVTKGCRPRGRCERRESDNPTTCVNREIDQPSCTTCCDSAFCNWEHDRTSLICELSMPETIYF